MPDIYPNRLETAIKHLESFERPGHSTQRLSKSQVKESDVIKIVAAALGGGAVGVVGTRLYDIAILRAALRGR